MNRLMSRVYRGGVAVVAGRPDGGLIASLIACAGASLQVAADPGEEAPRQVTLRRGD
jgi:hypothetical protein